MKINAETFLDNFRKYKLNNNIILISGNEPSLIFKIQNLVYDNIQMLGGFDKQIIDYKNIKKNEIIDLSYNKSLFNDLKILQIINPGDSLLSSLDNIETSGQTTIITGHEIKNSSKLKKYFDSHKTYLSIVCYKLSKEFKKKFIDRYIQNKNIVLSRDAYWFLLENSDNEYQLLENELEKIFIFTKEKINLNNIKKLLSNSASAEFDNLFFQCVLGNRKKIITNSQDFIKSSNDAYLFLQVIKKFSRILLITTEKKTEESIIYLVNSYLPKYLFKQKNNFQTLVEKTNHKKLISLNSLLQKTEIFLRKNENNYLFIIQRFLFNCAKILK